MRAVAVFAVILLSAGALAGEPAAGRLFPSPGGDVEYCEEETSAAWHMSLNTTADGKAARKSRTVLITRITSVTTHRFDSDGNETECCVFRPRNPNMATIELGADGNTPVVVNDSIDMSLPSERTVFTYLDDGKVAVCHWESSLGIEHLVLTDTLPVPSAPAVTGRKFTRHDSTGTATYYLNEHGCVSMIEEDRNDGTMTVTTYEGYRYDNYGNWTERRRYSLHPDGRHILTGTDRRRYRYR